MLLKDTSFHGLSQFLRGVFRGRGSMSMPILQDWIKSDSGFYFENLQKNWYSQIYERE